MCERPFFLSYLHPLTFSILDISYTIPLFFCNQCHYICLPRGDVVSGRQCGLYFFRLRRKTCISAFPYHICHRHKHTHTHTFLPYLIGMRLNDVYSGVNIAVPLFFFFPLYYSVVNRALPFMSITFRLSLNVVSGIAYVVLCYHVEVTVICVFFYLPTFNSIQAGGNCSVLKRVSSSLHVFQ